MLGVCYETPETCDVFSRTKARMLTPNQDEGTMKKITFLRCIATSFIALLVTSGFGQGTPARADLRTLQGFLRLRAPSANGREQTLLPTGPGWSSNFNFTPDTALVGHSAVYDAGTNTMIVFGGTDWGMDGFDTSAVLLFAPANGDGSWATLVANGAPGSPSARDTHTAVYDSANNRMIVFGGEDTNLTPLADVWVLSNANGQGGTPVWTQLSPSGSPPPARSGHTAVYDPANNLMVVFGGANDAQAFNDVWVLSNANGLGGTPAWSRLSPGGTPPKGVLYTSAVYDPSNNVMTVFGGFYAINVSSVSNGVWTLSHANGLGGTPQWTNIVANGASGSPAKRGDHTAVYDAVNNRMMIFGGLAGSGPASISGFNDVWVLTNANGMGGTPSWIKLNIAGVKPGTRGLHTAVYDSANNLMMIFAGDNFDPVYYVVWVLSHANGL